MKHRPSIRVLVVKIWAPQSSAHPFGQPSVAERLVLTFLVIATALSFRGICARLGRARVVSTEIYQLLLLILLAYLSFRPALSPCLALALLIYIVYEVVTWSIFDIFVESKIDFLQGRRSALRGFLWAVYSYLTISWAYGLYFWASGKILDSTGAPLRGVVAGLYYSVVTITTIGYGDYCPSKDNTIRFVVMSEPFVGIIILALYFAVLLSAVADSFSKSMTE